MNRRFSLSSCFLLAGLGLAGTAQAAVGVHLDKGAGSGQLFGKSFAAPKPLAEPCALAPAAGPIAFASPPSSVSKSSAILGGSASKLDEMIRQQAASQTTSLAAQPASMAASYSAAPCGGNTALVQTSLGISRLDQAQSAYGQNDFLQSKRLAVSHTKFDAAWSRVSGSRISRPARLKDAVRYEGADRQALLSSVNSWTNAKIRYVSDSTLYGKADYWADAATTLRKAAGDCEDIAIVKMQLLASAGVPMKDMNLTIAHDRIRGEAHAFLVVRSGERFVLLDDATNELLDARSSHDYMPIMTFSDRNKWLHGF